MEKKRRLSARQYKNHQMANSAKWKKEKTKSCNLTLNIEKDKDILEWLGKQKNKQAYLRQLIRKDIKG